MANKGSTEVDIQSVKRNWNISSRNRSHGLYAIALVDRDLSGLIGFRNSIELGPDEFIFEVSPQSMDIEEPAAVHIVPTQDGGQFIEHQGSIYKNISISGTMGMRPNKRTSGDVIPVLGIPNPFASPDLDQSTGLPVAESNLGTGFQRLLQLRNLFRRYFDAKRDPNIAHNTLMVWQNGKEGEYYIVEPMSFRTRRSSSAPLTSQYEMQLRTIKRLDIQLFDRSLKTRDDRTSLQKLNAFIQKKVTRTIGANLTKAETLIDSTVSLGQGTVNNVLSPARTLFNGLVESSAAGRRAIAIPRNSVALLAASALELVEEIYKSQSAINAYKTTGVMTPIIEAAHAYKQLFRGASRAHAQDRLFSPTMGSKFSTRAKAYDDPVSGATLSGGSKTDLSNVGAPAGTAIASVTNFDTIFSLAHKLLGDQARWKELVIVNDLKSPYIDPTGDGIDVLRPGDSIIYPSAPGAGSPGVSQDLSTEDDPIVRRLGRDIKLASFDAAGGVTELDLRVGTNGDLETIEGLNNMAQAVEIKFSTERGELPTHPTFGIAAPIGMKATIRTLIGFQIDARATLLSDSRIKEINRLDFSVDGNVLTVRAALQIVDINEGVAVSFDARR